MHKTNKIFTIIVSTLFTLSNLWRIVPDEVFFKEDLNILLQPLFSNTVICTVIAIVLAILGFFTILTMIFELKNTQKEHTFVLGSHGFQRFFSRWYSQVGTLSIICDDLQGWLVSDGNEDVLNALRRKSQNKELHLILGKEKPEEIVNELKALGAVVHHAPRDIILSYSFSCISVMGNNAAVIIRNKQKDERNMIKFEEISNTYVTGLLNVFIETVKGESI